MANGWYGITAILVLRLRRRRDCIPPPKELTQCDRSYFSVFIIVVIPIHCIHENWIHKQVRLEFRQDRYLISTASKLHHGEREQLIVHSPT